MNAPTCASAEVTNRTVIVPYRVPVNVVVDPGTGAVERVVVLDELIERDNALGIRDEDWNEVHDPDLTERAINIAEDREWPAWRFGS